MRKFLGFLILLSVSGFAMAQGGDGAAAAPLITITGPFSMGIAAGICALGMGKAIAAACEGIARNPGASGDIRTTMIIGLALIESLAIYTFASLFFA